MTKIRLGTNEDGTPLYHYASDGPVVFTGNTISGPVTLPDGTTYDVTEPFIEVASVEHAGLVSHAIGLRYETEGHPLHRPSVSDPDPAPFVHLCDDGHCGEQARPLDESLASFEARTNTDHPEHAQRIAAIRSAHANITQKG
jgi:hypothetical protein